MTAERNSRLFQLQLRAFALTWLGYASFYFTRKNLAVCKSRLHDEVGISIAALGTIDTAYLIAYAIGQFTSGALGDRLGPRWLLTIGMLGSATVSLVFGTSSALLPMFLAFTLNGFFQSTGWPGNVKAMQPFFATSQRGRVMGLWTTNYQVGGLLSTGLATYLLATFGWRSAFIVPGIYLAIVGTIVYLFLVERPEDKGESLTDDAPPLVITPTAGEARQPLADRGLLELVCEPLLLALGGAYFGLKLIRYSLLFWLPFYLRQHFHYSESNAGYMSRSAASSAR
jgi:sugar phosphate permease